MTQRVLYWFNGPGKDWVELAKEMRDSRDWRPVYWIALGNDELAADSFPDAILHRYYYAIRGLPPEGDVHVAPRALDAPTVERFLPCQSLVIPMMDRLDVEGSFIYRERLRHYYRLLSYWIGVCEQVKPDLAVFACTPHEVATYVAYCVCREFGVRTFIYVQTSLPRVVGIRTDADADILGLLGEYQRILTDSAVLDADERQRLYADDPAVPGDVRNYLNTLEAAYEAAEPEYMRVLLADQDHVRMRSELSVSNITRRGVNALKFWRWGLYARNYSRALSRKTKELRGRRLVDRAHEFKKPGMPPEESWMTRHEVKQIYAKAIAYKSALRQYYEEHATIFAPEGDYIYLALHLQPERTTSPEAGEFTHQMLMVKMLHDLLPEGWLLFVREHPSQFVPRLRGEQGRTEQFYRDLMELPNVRMVSLSAPPFDMLDSARAVATATGTVGWEAVVRGVPALVFGNAWYCSCRGVFSVTSLAALSEAYQRLAAGYRVPKGDVTDFVRAICRVGRRADTLQAGEVQSSFLSVEENVAGLSALLEAAFDEAPET